MRLNANLANQTRYTQIYDVILQDIRNQFGGSAFSIGNIPSAELRDSYRWFSIARDVNSGAVTFVRQLWTAALQLRSETAQALLERTRHSGRGARRRA